ncbi:hypothetical protein [Litchfieldia alkalitelluris]|uniref:hypothetical protein n=1 Tax=Litchfieldia alkalitelluris TaxID=304268 RepID=UPI0009972ECF|nr:hypothetical protein [Litchfieldia alkalitelluris]
MILEIFTNVGMSMVMFLRGKPNDEKVNRNMEMLKGAEWFKQIYSKNEELLEADEHLRYIVGWAKVEKILKSEKRTDKLREQILEAINER